MTNLCKSAGQFGIPAGLVFSMPVSFSGGCWSVRTDVTVTDELKQKLNACADELKMVSTRSEKMVNASVDKIAMVNQCCLMHLFALGERHCS